MPGAPEACSRSMRVGCPANFARNSAGLLGNCHSDSFTPPRKRPHPTGFAAHPPQNGEGSQDLWRRSNETRFGVSRKGSLLILGRVAGAAGRVGPFVHAWLFDTGSIEKRFGVPDVDLSSVWRGSRLRKTLRWRAKRPHPTGFAAHPPQYGEGSQDLRRRSIETRFGVPETDPTSFWGWWPAQPVGWGLSAVGHRPRRESGNSGHRGA